MASKLTALVTKRERHFASMQATYDLSLRCNEIISGSSDQSPVSPSRSATAADLSLIDLFVARMSHIDRTISAFESAQVAIESVNVKVDDEETITTVPEMKAFEELYYHSVAVLKKVEAFQNPTSSDPLQPRVPSNTPNRKVRLPDIKLPFFFGNIEQWSSFHSLFSSLIHDRTDLNASEKFHYLLSCVTPDGGHFSEPLKLIESLPINEENYTIAWDTLVSKYQNVRVLVAHHIDSMLAFRPIVEPSHAALSKFLNTFKTNTAALGALKVKKLDDVILLHIAVRNLDAVTRNQFEKEITEKEIPSFNDLVEFIETQCRIHSLTQTTTKTAKPKQASSPYHGKKSSPFVNNITTNSYRKCPLCKNEHTHRLYECDKFKALSISERQQLVTRKNLCPNCLGYHSIENCKSTYRCSECSKSHHSMLHFFRTNSSKKPEWQGSQPKRTFPHTALEGPSDQTAAAPCTLNACNNSRISDSNLVVLGTALVSILDRNGTPQPARIVIDPGSQIELITPSFAKRLGLAIKNTNLTFKSVGHRNPTEGYVECTLTPRNDSEPSFNVKAFLRSNFIDPQPEMKLDPSVRKMFSNLRLADPNFDQTGEIDLLIGGKHFGAMVNEGHNKIAGEPTALNTCFGWVLFGDAPILKHFSQPHVANTLSITCCKVDETLKQFWEIEEVDLPAPADPEDEACEAHFRKTHFRLPSGRYSVRLPFKDDPDSLPNCREIALKRFSALEARLVRKPELNVEYRKFMSEYISLEHMSPSKVPANYVIPHHVVMKYDSSTTKARTVFDASFSPEPNKPSLNKILMSGPKLQNDISDILCQFRLYKYVCCADIKMMYRQIIVQEEDRKYQRIFYRESPSVPVKEWDLNTVSFGTKPSAFLAQRTLLQLVEDEGEHFPLASVAIKNNLFVDDFVGGHNDPHQILALKQELVQLLGLGAFELRKWSSNFLPVLEGIPLEDQNQPLNLSSKEDSTLKVLGVIYNPSTDSFSYSVHLNPISLTKRGVLSEISKIFDPLGWLTPLTFYAKNLMQMIWQRGLSWDEPLPAELCEVWSNFVQDLDSLSSIRIPRHVPVHDSDSTKIIGFCDGSSKGYAAVIYIVTHNDGVFNCRLFKAKSKVAPLKVLSIPRLELRGAVLLAKLLASFKALKDLIAESEIQLYCDSTIVLSWIRTPPHLLKTYVANRVITILDHTAPQMWHHVKSAQNPADPASRGLPAKELVECEYWWNPSFICKSLDSRSALTICESPEYLNEVKCTKIVYSITKDYSHLMEVIKNVSSLARLSRIFAYVRRFIQIRLGSDKNQHCGPLTVQELKRASESIIFITQRHFYSKDVALIQDNKDPVSPELTSLTPFLDLEGLLRVGGRIDRASLPYNLKHPIIIPTKSDLAKLICSHYHKFTLHGGPRLVSSLISRKYWIPSLRKIIRMTIHKCLQCYLPKAKTLKPQMAELPPDRLRSLRPFHTVALDFSGPYYVKMSTRRNATKSKAYLLVIVCMEVKAVHLELVPDLSTDAFLRALDRFVARRGLCRSIFSDLGTNFVGAARQLREVHEMLRQNQNSISDHLASREITWRFNCPRAPHRNGLAESGVKSAKQHILKTAGGHSLTYEELETLVIRVEAILNSRPLAAMSSDHRDADYLTPGHFIIGEPLLAPPEEDVRSQPIAYTKRHKLISCLVQSIWKRWTAEYIPTLIPRSKWTERQQNLQINDVVFLKNENTAPLHWPVGRVEETHAGPDGVVRVARIKTANGSYLRPVHNMIPLPN